MQSRGCGEDAYYSALIQYPRQVVHCDTTKQFKLLIRMFALISGRPRPTRSSIIPCSFLSFPELLDVQERCWTSLESDRSFIHLPKVSSEAENSFSSIKIPSLPFILGLHTRQVIHEIYISISTKHVVMPPVNLMRFLLFSLHGSTHPSPISQ